MKLTRAQRRALERLRDAKDDDGYWEGEIVCEGIVCCIGTNRISMRTVVALLRILAISDRTDGGNGMGGERFRRFEINEVGRMYLKDESQIDVVRNFLATNQQFTLHDWKAVKL